MAQEHDDDEWWHGDYDNDLGEVTVIADYPDEPEPPDNSYNPDFDDDDDDMPDDTDYGDDGGDNPTPNTNTPEPCDKINTIINGTSNTNYMQKAKDLGTQQNLNLGYEKSVALIEGANTNIKEASGTIASASVQLPDLPGGQKYKTLTHTHSNVAGGTYSVFSFGDLQRLSMLSHSGQLDASEFVAFLSTYKGTNYALTITDKTKLEDFFYHINNSGTASGGNITKWISSQQNAQKIGDKYYNHQTDPFIKQTDTDNANVLSKFLDFIKEANLGVTIFETNANLDSFTKVEKRSNGVISRIPCN